MITKSVASMNVKKVNRCSRDPVNPMENFSINIETHFTILDDSNNMDDFGSYRTYQTNKYNLTQTNSIECSLLYIKTKRSLHIVNFQINIPRKFYKPMPVPIDSNLI